MNACRKLQSARGAAWQSSFGARPWMDTPEVAIQGHAQPHRLVARGSASADSANAQIFSAHRAIVRTRLGVVDVSALGVLAAIIRTLVAVIAIRGQLALLRPSCSLRQLARLGADFDATAHPVSARKQSQVKRGTFVHRCA